MIVQITLGVCLLKQAALDAAGYQCVSTWSLHHKTSRGVPFSSVPQIGIGLCRWGDTPPLSELAALLVTAVKQPCDGCKQPVQRWWKASVLSLQRIVVEAFLLPQAESVHACSFRLWHAVVDSEINTDCVRVLS